MGEKFMVQAWTQVFVNAHDFVIGAVPPGQEKPCESWHVKDGQRVRYDYITHYQGKSFFAALRRLIALKREGYGCVKMEWR